MNDPEKTLEEILEILTLLRSQNEIKRKFPKDTWGSIVRLTKMLPLDRVCERLKINPSYLKQKIRESTETLDFQEVPTHVQNSCFDTVTNNNGERLIKRAILNRKNAYFFRNETGAKIADILMSVMETCVLNDINPYNFFVAVQQHAADVRKNPKPWLPWLNEDRLKELAKV